jgi:hypothetical protein
MIYHGGGFFMFFAIGTVEPFRPMTLQLPSNFKVFSN